MSPQSPPALKTSGGRPSSEISAAAIAGTDSTVSEESGADGKLGRMLSAPGFCTDTSPEGQEASETFESSTNTIRLMALHSFGNLFDSQIAFNNKPKCTNDRRLVLGGAVRLDRRERRLRNYLSDSESSRPDPVRQGARLEVGPGAATSDDKNRMAADNPQSLPLLRPAFRLPGRNRRTGRARVRVAFRLGREWRGKRNATVHHFTRG